MPRVLLARPTLRRSLVIATLLRAWLPKIKEPGCMASPGSVAAFACLMTPRLGSRGVAPFGGADGPGSRNAVQASRTAPVAGKHGDRGKHPGVHATDKYP